ncbi:MAG TPA: class I SAM-dependent methyltransferase, partial [Longimicrobiales bacterium]|nr:class I SAM-dependent methyltransferase [Longimicrobiales bacterium]
RWTAAGDEADPARAPSLAFLDWLPTAAAYVVGRPGSVLVLGSAGGLEVLGALRHGADSVTGVELVGPLVEVTGWVLGEGADLYRRRGVRPVVGDARAFAAEAEERFDVVVLPPAGRFGVAAAGVYAAGEDYMSTVEAFADYLERLAPGGVLAITGWLRTPPRNGAKTLLTAVRALRLAGVEEPGGSLVFLRSWATGTLLVKPDGFAPEELDRVRAFALERRVDVDWPPPPEGAEPPTFNRMERPVFRQAAAAAAAGPDSARAWAARYPFHVAPATDDRPYAHRFLRLSSLPELLSRGRGAMLPVAEWGYLAVVATLFQSGLLAALLLLVPAAVLVARRGDGPPLDGTRSGLARTAGYFGAIGLGFALVEITAIQRLGLVLGHPVYATSAALAALLAFSGLGSWASDRWEAGRGARACLAVGIGALVGAALIPRAGVLLPLPFGARMTLGGVAVGGLGFLMGWPFPTGLRRLAGRGAPVAWAWAANGFASVVGVSLATLLAMEL